MEFYSPPHMSRNADHVRQSQVKTALDAAVVTGFSPCRMHPATTHSAAILLLLVVLMLTVEARSCLAATTSHRSSHHVEVTESCDYRLLEMVVSVFDRLGTHNSRTDDSTAVVTVVYFADTRLCVLAVEEVAKSLALRQKAQVTVLLSFETHSLAVEIALGTVLVVLE